MRKAVLGLAAMMVLAAPVLAYVQPGSLSSKTTTREGDRVAKEQSDNPGLSDPSTTEVPATIEPVEGAPVKPVPEPGTMAMASMGLLAIGAALRHRRNR